LELKDKKAFILSKITELEKEIERFDLGPTHRDRIDKSIELANKYYNKALLEYAISLYENASNDFKLALDYGYQRDQKIYLNMAFCEFNLNKPITALEYFDASIGFIDITKKKEYYETFFYKGLCLDKLKNIKNAVDNYDIVLALLKEKGHFNINEIKILFHCYKRKGDYIFTLLKNKNEKAFIDESVEIYYDKALLLISNIDLNELNNAEKTNLFEIFKNRKNKYLNFENYSKYLNDLHFMSKLFVSRLEKSYCYNNIAILNSYLKEYQEATIYFNNALECAKEIKKNLYTNYYNLAISHLLNKNYDKAYKFALKAKKDFNPLEHKNLDHIYNILAISNMKINPSLVKDSLFFLEKSFDEFKIKKEKKNIHAANYHLNKASFYSLTNSFNNTSIEFENFFKYELKDSSMKYNKNDTVIFYKYYPINTNTISLLKNKELAFKKIQDNSSYIHIINILKKILKDGFNDFIKRNVISIFSLNKDNDNKVLHSNYCDRERGFIVGYKFKKLPDNIGFGQVIYEKNLPYIDLLNDIRLESTYIKEGFEKDFNLERIKDNTFKTCFFSNDSSLSYEKEIRFIKLNNPDNINLVDLNGEIDNIIYCRGVKDTDKTVINRILGDKIAYFQSYLDQNYLYKLNIKRL